MRCAVLDIRTVSAAELARWETAAEPERRARWQQFRRPDDRARSICADHLARTLLHDLTVHFLCQKHPLMMLHILQPRPPQ